MTELRVNRTDFRNTCIVEASRARCGLWRRKKLISLPLGMDVSMPQEAHQQFKRWVTDRQVGRLYVVGSNDTTAPVIDASYRRFLAPRGRIARAQLASAMSKADVMGIIETAPVNSIIFATR